MQLNLPGLGMAIVVICLFLLVVTEGAKRMYAAKLAKLLEMGRAKQYLSTLDQPMALLVFPAWNRGFMRLNGLLMLDDYAQIDELLPSMLEMRQSAAQRRELVTKAFNYQVERGRKSAAAKLLAEIEGWGDADVARQARTTYDIYLDGSSAYIPEMEARLRSASGVDRGFLELLLSVQYENKGDARRAQEYLKRSEADMATPASGR